MRHADRETLAATIKGVTLEEQLKLKQSSSTRDPVDDFAAWHERFLHELTTEFGPLPDDFSDAEAPSDAINSYIKQMKKQFRLRLK